MLSVPKHNTKVVDSVVAGFLGNVIIPVADQKKVFCGLDCFACN